MEIYKDIYFSYGAIIECGNVTIDNVFSINMLIEDNYINMDLNDSQDIIIGTIVQCENDSITVNATEYQDDGTIDKNNKVISIVKNGKVIYK